MAINFQPKGGMVLMCDFAGTSCRRSSRHARRSSHSRPSSVPRVSFHASPVNRACETPTSEQSKSRTTRFRFYSGDAQQCAALDRIKAARHAAFIIFRISQNRIVAKDGTVGVRRVAALRRKRSPGCVYDAPIACEDAGRPPSHTNALTTALRFSSRTARTARAIAASTSSTRLIVSPCAPPAATAIPA